LSSNVDVNNAHETRPAPVVVESDKDKKLLLPLIAIKKPLAVIAGGLSAGGQIHKNLSISSPAATKPIGNNNVLVIIDGKEQLAEKSEEEEPRKLLLPMIAMKPLLIASMMTGIKLDKLPAITPPKIGITITKHEYPKKFADETTS